ncbi:HECT domain-containing protein [Lasiodiplodia theobromae]|nr:HECT domain-containing protein [Lasiodiplodia theobromae]
MPSLGNKQHSRSLSHPFPSIFGGGKKPRPHAPPNGDFLPESDRYMPPASYGAMGAARGPPVFDRRDEETANCLTCDSKVRYPRGLTTFRCSACLMVNDLVPVSQDKPDRSPGQPKRPMPLTVDRAKHIIDRCLETYLQNMVERRSRSSQDSDDRPRGSQDSAFRPRGSLDAGKPGDARLAPIPIRQRAQSASRPMISVSPPSAAEKPNGADMLKNGRTPPRPNGPRGPPTPEEIFAPPPTLRHPPRSGTVPSPPNRRPPPPPVHPPPPPPGPPGPYAGRGSPREIPPHAGSLPAPGVPPISPTEIAERRRYEQMKTIFRPLEDHLIASYGNFDCLNTAFMLGRARHTPRTRSEGAMANERPIQTPQAAPPPAADSDLFLEADARMLMIGDIGENASWWPGRPEKESPKQAPPSNVGRSSSDVIIVNHKSPLINWTEVQHWYDTVNGAGTNWRARLEEMPNLDFPEPLIQEADEEIRDARVHVQRTLLKITENLLKRPGRPLEDPEDLRFLLIILYNPLLHAPSGSRSPPMRRPPPTRPRQGSNPNQPPALGPPPPLGRPPLNQPPSPKPMRSASNAKRDPSQHSGIIKRILGLLANLDNECHRYLTTWFSRLAEDHFRRMVDLVGKFITYRLTRQPRKRSNSGNPTAGLIPEFGAQGATSAQLHAALGLSGSGSKSEDRAGDALYSDDWQVKAAAKVMALLFAANNTYHNRKTDPVNHSPSVAGQASAGLAARERARAHGQLLPTSDFYNTVLDFHDLIADFEAWEKRTGKFSFCQYPFFLSIGAKIKIMEHDARRQMENKAREAFFDSILSNKNLEQYFHLRVRRECLAEDSLRRISEVVGGGGEEIKKGLRVQFVGEEGIDAGGLRKEWFLMLVRELFDPNHGMFVYDEDSQFCYFNPNTFEQSDQFFLVGAVLGLALYNSTILDVALPPFAFKKLLASAPTKNGVAPASRNRIDYTLDDLAEFRPRLAKGLRQLLEFDGDVEATFCRDFVAEVERYGVVQQVPLCKNGENRPVTNANRKEFVDLYVRYFLDTAVARQFDPFRRGFFTVCGGNALSLFRSEEIELMVRGSDEPLDVSSLRAVAVYDGWSDPAHGGRKVDRPGEQILVLRWFWDWFAEANPIDQRKILSFITGSDRIPAVGATNLVIKIGCLGDDSDRFPVARTCFNMLQLYKYKSRQKLVDKLWRAVVESEGFGLK